MSSDESTKSQMHVFNASVHFMKSSHFKMDLCYFRLTKTFTKVVFIL